MNGKRYSVNGEGVAAATAVPDATLQAALTTYENARMDGLCHEGAWESALDALRTFGLESMIGDEELLDQIRHQIRNR